MAQHAVTTCEARQALTRSGRNNATRAARTTKMLYPTAPHRWCRMNSTFWPGVASVQKCLTMTTKSERKYPIDRQLHDPCATHACVRLGAARRTAAPSGDVPVHFDERRVPVVGAIVQATVAQHDNSVASLRGQQRVCRGRDAAVHRDGSQSGAPHPTHAGRCVRTVYTSQPVGHTSGGCSTAQTVLKRSGRLRTRP